MEQGFKLTEEAGAALGSAFAFLKGFPTARVAKEGVVNALALAKRQARAMTATDFILNWCSVFGLILCFVNLQRDGSWVFHRCVRKSNARDQRKRACARSWTRFWIASNKFL